jgi:hypothetical protein
MQHTGFYLEYLTPQAQCAVAEDIDFLADQFRQKVLHCLTSFRS